MTWTAHYETACFDDTAGSNGPVCQTDNATVTVFRQGSLSSSEKSKIVSTLNADYNNPIDLNVVYQTSSEVTYSGSAETDIIYQKSPYQYGTTAWSGGLIGETWCDDAVSGVSCDQQYVRFKSSIVLDYSRAPVVAGSTPDIRDLRTAMTGRSVAALVEALRSTPVDSAALPYMSLPADERYQRALGR